MAFTERLMTGVNISILGMGLVFLLLALLWGLLTVLLRLDREPPSGEIAEGRRIDRPAAVIPRGMAPELFAAIRRRGAHPSIGPEKAGGSIHAKPLAGEHSLRQPLGLRRPPPTDAKLASGQAVGARGGTSSGSERQPDACPGKRRPSVVFVVRQVIRETRHAPVHPGGRRQAVCHRRAGSHGGPIHGPGGRGRSMRCASPATRTWLRR